MYDQHVIFPKHPSANFNAEAPPKGEHWLARDARFYVLDCMDVTAEQRLEEAFAEAMRELSRKCRSSEGTLASLIDESTSLMDALFAGRAIIAARRESNRLALVEARERAAATRAEQDRQRLAMPAKTAPTAAPTRPKLLRLTMPPKGRKLTPAEIAETTKR